jgi:hypothetical protein
MLSRKPFEFLAFFKAAMHRRIARFLRNYLKVLAPLLAFQVFVVLVGVYLTVTGRLEPAISANAVVVTNFQDIILVVIVAILFVLTIAASIVLSMTCWHAWQSCTWFLARQQAKESFVAAKLKWPWCPDSATTTVRTGLEDRRYSYKLISEDEIRLLRVFRAGKDARFEVELIHMSLIKRPIEYLAVSYTWDDPYEYSKVYFSSGHFLQITKSVHIILDTLLAPGDCIHLWIDGLCINQKDEAEKSAQVMLMREIYSYAQQVVICLGEATSSSDKAMDSIVPLQEAFRNISRGPYGSSQISKLRLEGLVKLGFGLPEESWIALGELLSRRWWNRVWVIQEAAVGSDPIFICGHRAVNWNVMASVITNLLVEGSLMRLLISNPEDPNSPLTQPVKAATHVTQMSAARTQVHLDKLPNFQDILMEMIGYDATNERDRVYALLGLSCDQEDIELRPDYNLPVREVYTLTARHLLLRKKSLLILHKAGIKSSLNLKERLPSSKEDVPDIDELPSWVPDWQSKPASEDGLCFAKGWAKYRASGSSIPCVTSPSNDVLVVRGIIVDIVQDVSKLKKEHEQRLQASKELYSKAQPSNEPSEMRLFDLEDERKITTQWVSEHINLMLQSRKKSPSGAATDTPWKDQYERTIMAADPYSASESAFNSEFSRIWIAAAAKYLSLTKLPFIIPPSNDIESVERATLFHQRFMTVTKNRRFFTTEAKRVGFGSQCTASGDIVVIFLGASTPFIIREVSSANVDGGRSVKEYKLVGEAYVDGLMAGEGVRGLKRANLKVVDIRLR